MSPTACVERSRTRSASPKTRLPCTVGAAGMAVAMSIKCRSLFKIDERIGQNYSNYGRDSPGLRLCSFRRMNDHRPDPTIAD